MDGGNSSCFLFEMGRAAAFLDRDGVLNVDTGYLHRIEDLEWIQGAQKAVGMLNEAGFLVVIITNQSGIGRGYFTEADFLKLTEGMKTALKLKGAQIDAVYFCPNHPEHGLGSYKVACDFRKPRPGMILQAIKEWEIELTQSFFIGDRESDRKAAEAAGVKFHMFEGGDLAKFVASIL